MGFETFAEGTLIANGAEQTVTEITEAVRFSGYISLSQLQAGNTVVLRQYIKLFAIWEKYNEEIYSGLQVNPIIYFTPKEIASSLKVTLQQTAGVLRAFSYKFIKEKASVAVTISIAGVGAAAVFSV